MQYNLGTSRVVSEVPSRHSAIFSFYFFFCFLVSHLLYVVANGINVKGALISLTGAPMLALSLTLRRKTHHINLC